MSKKVYVVWHGKEPGVFTEWLKCRDYINGYKGAKYKAFKSIEAANMAFKDGYEIHWGQGGKFESELSPDALELIGDPIYPSLSVDAAWNTATLMMEYQGVDTLSCIKIFHQGPFEEGTQNVGEFLAIVHALAHLKKTGSSIPVYSDSRNAIGWVKEKTQRSKLTPTDKNKKLFELLDRALKWLKENDYSNPVLKWETKAWGENPADFGRK
ncbi:MAG: ribonuclease H [Sphingobacteriales bacterium]|nr:MAG: ribonuclease H [Sphingobacteriales bacterium]